MGKKRNTAKTGDKALYKSRDDEDVKDSSREVDDDGMYNKIDRFHNERQEEFLKLDATAQDSDDDGEQEEAVMDLGIGGESSDEISDSSDDDSENDGGDGRAAEDSAEEELSSSDDDEEQETEDVRDWGSKKSAYYSGDTADLEIGQDKEDAYLEEEAAKEVQASRMEVMSEDDFVLSDTEEDKHRVGDEEEDLTSVRDASKLSLKDKRRLLDKQHPEYLPLLSYFSTVVKDLDTRTATAAGALFDGEEGNAEAVGSTSLGQQFLLTKSLLQSTTALNLAMYLLLKAEQSSQDDADSSLIQTHPVMARLQKWNAMTQKLDDRVESKVDGLREQLDNLVKAASLMNSGLEDDEEESVVDDDENDDDGSSVEISDGLEMEDESVSADAEVDGDEMKVAEQARRNVLNEARFGLRRREIDDKPKASKRRRRAIASDLGDDGDVSATASKSLASTLNAIEQRSAASKKRVVTDVEGLDDPEEEDAEMRRGLEMMEADLGKAPDDEDAAEPEDEYDNEPSGHEKDEGFYARAKQKSKEKKEFKKNLYKVAPKFPRAEKIVEGERAINKTILKNRGLIAHKAKINRNPRVKKREQYRKAVIRRKGAVRDIRTDEGHKYGGEETGIKSNLSRSHKFA